MTKPHSVPSIPSYGVLKGKGKCRVLSIDNDFVELLSKRDERILVHRNRVTFTNK